MLKLIATSIFLLGLFNAKAQTDSILFIGNSYTYYNSMPTILASMAAADGKSVYISSHTAGGATLFDHYNNSSVTTLINSANWDYVILQEQSQMIAINPASTQYYMGQFYNRVENNYGCTELVAFMTWARKEGNSFYTTSYTYDDMVNDYENFYQTSVFPNVALGRISPVGSAFHEATRQGYEVYSGDGSHPSGTGSYLAACVFYATLFKESPVGNSYTTLGTTATNDMQQIAEDLALGDSYEYWIDKVDFTISDTTILVNETVDYSEYFWYDDNTPSFSWNFEGGSPAVYSGASVTISYDTPGTYDVSLTVTDGCGYQETRTMADKITVNSVNAIESAQEAGAWIYPSYGSAATQFVLETNNPEVQDWSLVSAIGVNIPFKLSKDGIIQFNQQPGQYILKNHNTGQHLRFYVY